MAQTIGDKPATTVVDREFDYRDLSLRDVGQIAIGVLLVVNLIWMAWTQTAQNNQLAAMRQQLDSQLSQVTNLNSEFNNFVQSQAAAEANRATSPNAIPVVPFGSGGTGTGPSTEEPGTTGGGVGNTISPPGTMVPHPLMRVPVPAPR